MNDPSIKPVRLTGAAAAEVSGLTKNKRRASKKGGNGGDHASSSSPAAPAAAPPAPAAAPSTPLPSPASPAASPAPPASPAPTSTTPQAEGGAKTIRVELKKRTSTKKVHLQPKGVKKNPSPVPSSSLSPTKKTRKVTLAVKSLHKRMSRAKKMTRKVKEMSLPQLREHLIQKKLIKPTSKAPEVILRQIAADAQIVAGKAL